MSYKCEICGTLVAPKVAQRRHVISREVPNPPNGVRREIAREVAVCGTCASRLVAGAPLASIRKERRADVGNPLPEPVARPGSGEVTFG